MFHKTIRECLAYYEAFRRLGFTPDQIGLAVFPDRLGMQLTAQGNVFIALAGKYDGDAVEEWGRASQWWNDSSVEMEDKMEIYRNSYVYDHGVQLLLALKAKGINWKKNQRRRSAHFT